MSNVIDSYPESNFTDDISVCGAGACSATGVGQCFTGDGEKITQVRWYLNRHSAPTGNAVAKIYTMTGTFGTDGTVGTLLATSDNVDITTIQQVGHGVITFPFSGANQYVTTNGTKYVATMEYVSGGDNSNYLAIGYDGTSATHPGTWVFSNDGSSTWTPVDADIDICFYVDGVVTATLVDLTGVSATPAIGDGTFNVTFTPTGVACSPGTGSGAFSAACSASGVAATPEIGNGTVTGASGDRLQVGGKRRKLPKPPRRRSAQVDVMPPPPPYVEFSSLGVMAAPSIGYRGFVAIDQFMFVRGVRAGSMVGKGITSLNTDILDDEMVALLLADSVR